jgi:hypothetical protein
MSYIGGVLTIDGYTNFNAPGPSTGIVIDGQELTLNATPPSTLPRQVDWAALGGETSIANKPTKLSDFANDINSVPGDLNVFGNLYIGGEAAASAGSTALSAFVNDLKGVSGDFRIAGNLIVDGGADITPPGSQAWTDAVLQNGSANVTGEQPLQFCIDINGYTRARGFVTLPAVGQTIFTLPVGARPNLRHRFYYADTTIDVLANGSVLRASGTLTSVFLSFVFYPV